MTRESIRRRSPTQMIVEDLGKRILAGKIHPDERLGIEQVLCESFGVSRTVIREALQALASKGLITSRPRVGSVVRAVECWNFLDTDIILWTDELGEECRFYGEILEARSALEPRFAFLAAKRATTEDIHLIEQALLKMEAATEVDDKVAYHQADLEFHLGILRATHNVVMLRFGSLIRAAMNTGFRLAISEERISREGMRMHRCVFEAICDRDPAMAAQWLEAITELLKTRLTKSS